MSAVESNTLVCGQFGSTVKMQAALNAETEKFIQQLTQQLDDLGPDCDDVASEYEELEVDPAAYTCWKCPICSAIAFGHRCSHCGCE